MLETTLPYCAVLILTYRFLVLHSHITNQRVFSFNCQKIDLCHVLHHFETSHYSRNCWDVETCRYHSAYHSAITLHIVSLAIGKSAILYLLLSH